jgi:hypothetical protein
MSLENSSPSGRASLYALNAKIAEITRRNAEANFALTMKLAETKDVNQAMELQSRRVCEQMETFVHQLEEMRDLRRRSSRRRTRRAPTCRAREARRQARGRD